MMPWMQRILLLLLVLFGQHQIITSEDIPTPIPTPIPTALPTGLLTAAPTAQCNATVCLELSGSDYISDPECCARRTKAACESGFIYSSGEICGTDSSGNTLRNTCCEVDRRDGNNDDDGLTRVEEIVLIVVLVIFFGTIFICIIYGLYSFCAGGCKYPDLGSVGSIVYYDERRGQCFGLIIFFTIFCFVTLALTYLSASDDPEMVQAFAFARIQMTDDSTFITVGLSGYVVVSSETSSSQGEFNAFGSDYGKDANIGDRSDFDWTGECETAGQQISDMLIPVFIVKVFCAAFVYLRNNPNTDQALYKLAGVFFETWCGIMILAMLLSFGLRCFEELPTGKVFLPDDDAEYLYYYDAAQDDLYGSEYKVSFKTPYTSFFTTLFSGLSCFYIAWVHWRMSCWGSELYDKAYY